MFIFMVTKDLTHLKKNQKDQKFVPRNPETRGINYGELRIFFKT